MKKSFFTSPVVFFVLLISIFFYACGQKNSAPEIIEKNQDSDSLKKAVILEKSVLSNDLSVLFIESKEFERIIGDTSTKNKVTFSLYITESALLNLHGWKNSEADSSYKPEPDIILRNGVNSTYLRPKTYLSNLVLSYKSIKNIIKNVKNKKYILFFPQDPLLNDGHLFYKIKITDTDPSKGTFSDLLNAAGEDLDDLNPSPPRNSNNGTIN